MKPKSPYVIVKCENCGGVFSRLLSHQIKNKHTFCSLQCRYDWTKRKWREGKTQIAKKIKTNIRDEHGRWRKGCFHPKAWKKPVHDIELLEAITNPLDGAYLTTGEIHSFYNMLHTKPISMRHLNNLLRQLEQEGKITRKNVNNCKHGGGRTYHITWRKKKCMN